MATIDVRKENETIDIIVFGDEAFIDGITPRDIDINTDDGGDCLTIDIDDVDNLIKALIKAKEISRTM